MTSSNFGILCVCLGGTFTVLVIIFWCYMRRLRRLGATDRGYLVHHYKGFISKLYCLHRMHTTSCCICMELFHYGDRLAIPSCRHAHHERCLRVWLVEHNTCPFCMQPIKSGLVQTSTV